MAPRETRVETGAPQPLSGASAKRLVEQLARVEAERTPPTPVRRSPAVLEDAAKTRDIVAKALANQGAACVRITSVLVGAAKQIADQAKLFELVVPVEFDGRLKTQPRRVVRLRSTDTDYTREVASDDPKTKRDPSGPVWLLRFTEVPPGRYALDVGLGAGWLSVATGLRVGPEGITVEDTPPPPLDSHALGSPEEDDESPPEEPPPDPHEIHHDFNAVPGDLA